MCVWRSPLRAVSHLIGYSRWVYRFVSREDPFNTIDDELVIGRRLLPSEVPSGFDNHIDLTAEFEEPKPIRCYDGYLSFPILDGGIPTMKSLDKVLKAIEKGKTYIHCAQGHGRTGLFAIALLHHRQEISTVSEGIRLLQNQRPGLDLNRTQRKFLERYFGEK